MTGTWPRVMRPFSETFVTPLLRRWRVMVLLGLALVVIGVLLLLDVSDAVGTVAVLVAIGLVTAAVDEIAQADRHDRRWAPYVLGAIWILTAVWAVARPDVTLWALAASIGVGFVVGGLAETAFALLYRRELPMWGIWLVDGVASVAIGVLALAWPEATIRVVAVLAGLRLMTRGASTVAFGLALRQLNAMTGRVRT